MMKDQQYKKGLTTEPISGLHQPRTDETSLLKT